MKPSTPALTPVQVNGISSLYKAYKTLDMAGPCSVIIWAGGSRSGLPRLCLLDRTVHSPAKHMTPCRYSVPLIDGNIRFLHLSLRV